MFSFNNMHILPALPLIYQFISIYFYILWSGVEGEKTSTDKYWMIVMAVGEREASSGKLLILSLLAVMCPPDCRESPRKIFWWRTLTVCPPPRPCRSPR